MRLCFRSIVERGERQWLKPKMLVWSLFGLAALLLWGVCNKMRENTYVYLLLTYLYRIFLFWSTARSSPPKTPALLTLGIPPVSKQRSGANPAAAPKLSLCIWPCI